MTIHNCIYCNYSTTKKSSFDVHLSRPKHKLNISKYNELPNDSNKYIIDISNNIFINKIDNIY